MTHNILIGLDGSKESEKVLAFAKSQAKHIPDCELIVAYVIEWSPFSFHTAEENATRHKRREEELSIATSRITDPVVTQLQADGFAARGAVRHGDVAKTLDALARENGATQIVVGRVSAHGISDRIFGSATQNLVMQASVPVTVVG